jgi:PAS domain S-box-containing protein
VSPSGVFNRDEGRIPGSCVLPRLRDLSLVAGLGLWGMTAHAMPSAAAGMNEVGAPSFSVLGLEELGLSSAPTDLDLMPDGRIVVTSLREIAFGDGIRWETFHEVEGQTPVIAEIAVADDGQIYTAEGQGAARVEFIANEQWRCVPVETFPGGVDNQSTVTQFSDDWYWTGGSGSVVVAWRPGSTARVVGRSVVASKILELDGRVFISDLASGVLSRLRADGTPERLSAPDGVSVSDGVTCAVPFGAGRLLVGTTAAGLEVFDGKTMHPFGPKGALNQGHRITDLCAATDGYFAASIDDVGIVFFDHQGHTVQVLDRALDHRLARSYRLQYSQDGVLWALLGDGVARVEFPSAVSHFEPLLPGGLAYVEPLRHAGMLWVLADGRAMRGLYDPSGRLEGFVDDTPPGRYLFSLIDRDGRLFASNDDGVFLYEGSAWRQILSGISNARLMVARSGSDAIFYVATGQFGVIERKGDGYVTRPTLLPALGESYNSVVDAAGIGWLELGESSVARFDPHAGNPTFRILGRSDGVPEGWAELYQVSGIVRLHVGGHLCRFDEATGKFVEDRDLLAEIPQLAVAMSRPVTDNLGRLWFTADGRMRVIERHAAGGDRSVTIPTVATAPGGYTMEDDGVVWLSEKRKLARMDLRLPGQPNRPLRALITSVQLPASHRLLFAPGAALENLDYADDSMTFTFAAPANPFGSPLTFEVLLEGAGTHWVSSGTVGSATFTRLKEGNYAFHVRPIAAGAAPGTEAMLKFTILAPWYRTTLAWASYIAATLGLFVFVTWLSFFLQRREKSRLERLVAKRTRELSVTNAELARQMTETNEKSAALSLSEESFRQLSTKLEERVKTRTAELSHTNVELGQREALFRLIFEHAPVGISWRRVDLANAYHVNATFGHILDLSGDALTDYTHLATLVHPDDAVRHAKKNRLIAIGKSDSYILEERFVVEGGRLVWGLLSVAVIRDDAGRILQEISILEDITLRKRAEEELVSTHKRLIEISRQAGMAEVATGVLHNVGNVLNSVNVSATLVADNLRHTKAVNIGKLSELFAQHKGDLAEFLTKDSRGLMIPGYLGALAESLAAERATVAAELDHLRTNIDHIKDIVAMQQTYARTSGIVEAISIPELIEDALRINAGSLTRHSIDIFRDYQVRPVITTEKQKVMQILINLVGNAKYACDESGRTDKKITVRITANGARSVTVAVIDNGIGVPTENLNRIFNHGFTTRKLGHGFGLHSGALAAKELGGSLTVHSEGPGLGATFILELPYTPDSNAHENASN